MKKSTTNATSKVTTAKKSTKPTSGGTAKKASRAAAVKKTARTEASPSTVSSLKVGQKAPAFALSDDKGKTVKLSGLKGKKVVLFFYPKDDTPGCTMEACSFRDGLAAIKQSGAVVLGVSPDSIESHKKFSKKFSLNFPLLSDVEKKMLLSYGVWKEKSMYGRKYMGIERTTYVIDQKGKIAAIFPKVKVAKHYEEVLHTLSEMA